MQSGHTGWKAKLPDKFLHFCHRANELFQRILKNGESNGTDSEADVLVAMMLGERMRYQPSKNRILGIAAPCTSLRSVTSCGCGCTGRWWAFWNITATTEVKIIAGLEVFFSVQITGGQPSAMRAFIMVTCLWVHISPRGKVTFPRACHLSGNNTNDRSVATSNLGFQFSYAVVSVILLYGLPLAEGLKTYFEKDLNHTGTVNLSM